MPEISNYDLSCYIAIAIGLIALLSIFFLESKIEKLSKTGERAEGVIFDTDTNSAFRIELTSSHDAGNSFRQTATVRFVTKKQEWITAEIKNEIGLVQPYRQGFKVNVFYDPGNPYDFVVTPTGNYEWTKWLFIIVGVSLILGGVLCLLFSI